MRIKIGMLSFITGVIIISALSARGATVVGSRHDLSSAGEQICIYCHTPHYANTDKSGLPLWNRAISDAVTFTMYSSATMDAAPPAGGKPSLASLACLGCHDGVNATVNYNGNNVSTKHDLLSGPGGSIPDMTSNPNCERCHTNFYSGNRRVLVLGTDLSNDHPVSIVYPTPAQDPAFVQPASGAVNGLPLFGTSKNQVECSTCHNVHDPANAPFLRVANTGSALCYKCHNK